MKYIREYIDWDNEDFEIEEDDPTIPNEFSRCEKFYVFLKKNKIVDIFKNEFHKFNNKTIDEYLNRDFNDDTEYIHLINYSFTWDETQQGDAYWREIDGEWRNYINK